MTCARNKVSVFVAADPGLEIGAGYFQQWPAGGPKPLIATGNAAAQIDIADSIEAAERLLDQAMRLQNRRPF